MRNLTSLLTAMSILLLCVSSNAYSQTKPHDFFLTIVVEQDILSLPKGVKLKVKIENKSGRTATKDELRALTISLTKYGKHAEDCLRGDCFGATYRLNGLNELKSGETFQVEIDLTDLYWNDMISNSIDLNEPKNMSQVILAGSYYLSVSLYFPAANSTKQDPREMEIKSNEIMVKVL